MIESAAALSDRALRLPPELRLAEGGPQDAQSRPEPEPRPAGELTAPLWQGKRFKEGRDAVLEDFERGYLQQLLREHDGNVSQAARAAGVHRNILHRLLARHRLR